MTDENGIGTGCSHSLLLKDWSLLIVLASREAIFEVGESLLSIFCILCGSDGESPFSRLNIVGTTAR